MTSTLSFESRRAAEVAKAESLLKSAMSEVETTNNNELKLRVMWELAFVHLRELETYRPAGGWDEKEK